MNANEFLHKKNVAYMNRLSTSLDFNAVVALMEEYAALRIHDVVGRSEQLVCDKCVDGLNKSKSFEKGTCVHCREKV